MNVTAEVFIELKRDNEAWPLSLKECQDLGLFEKARKLLVEEFKKVAVLAKRWDVVVTVEPSTVTPQLEETKKVKSAYQVGGKGEIYYIHSGKTSGITERAGKVLAALVAAGKPLSARELGELTGYHRGGVQIALNGLCAAGKVRKDREYKIGVGGHPATYVPVRREPPQVLVSTKVSEAGRCRTEGHDFRKTLTPDGSTVAVCTRCHEVQRE